MKKSLLIAMAAFMLSSCVAKRYLVESQEQVARLQSDSTQLQNSVYDLQKKISQEEKNSTELNQKISDLNNTIADLNRKNTQLGQQSSQQLTQLTQNQQDLAQAQRDLAEQQQKLLRLESLMNQQKQASEELRKKMTDALQNYNSNDLSVYQKNGKVYISLSENLLFPSGSAVVNKDGVEALSKLAEVLNQNPDVSIQIEGNTDSIPIKGKYQDNWELSTARANSIVRILVEKYAVNPKSVISVGHSYYDPVDTNETKEGRAKNRRTDIVLMPNLEELYNLIGQY